MWPRTEEERLSKRNFGFVSFKNRKDAEHAKECLEGYVYEDYKMNLSWSKPVKIHTAPFVLPGRVENQNSILSNDVSSSKIDIKIDKLEASPLNSSNNINNTIEMCKDIISNNKIIPIEKEMDINDIGINIEIPKDKKLLAIINLTAKFVAADGEAFEQVK
jgi:RNA recognition motif-containing protein